MILFNVVGDSLGKKQFLGWQILWTSDWFCSVCKTTYAESTQRYSENGNILRSRLEYENDVVAAKNNDDGAHHGIKWKPVLADPNENALKYFHPVDNLHCEVSFFSLKLGSDEWWGGGRGLPICVAISSIYLFSRLKI